MDFSFFDFQMIAYYSYSVGNICPLLKSLLSGRHNKGLKIFTVIISRDKITFVIFKFEGIDIARASATSSSEILHCI